MNAWCFHLSIALCCALLTIEECCASSNRSRRFSFLKQSLNAPTVALDNKLLAGIFDPSQIDSKKVEEEIHNFHANGSAVNNFEKTEKDGKVCYGVLGCFGRLDFFHPIFRPINFLPQSPEQIKMTYSVYTAQNKYKPDVLYYDATRTEIEKTQFDGSKKTKFIIHGFSAEFDDMTWMGDLKDVIFNIAPDEFNVIAVDWSGGSQTATYNQAVANTRVVGAATAYLIEKLVHFKNATVEDIHIIGHSLGAHTSGYAGERFKGPKIGRITGLDPAGPCFNEDNPKSRLDITDATYVDIVHTDYASNVISGLGLEDAIGRDDFYPNSGNNQPGCSLTKSAFNVLSQGLGEGISQTISCQHQRAYNLFATNPRTQEENCQFVGYECGSYSDFVAGKCADCGPNGDKCAVMSILGPDNPTYGPIYKGQMERGIANHKKNRRLYFKTTESKPFCLHHYQIMVYFDHTSDKSTGLIKLNLYGSRRNYRNIKLSEAFSSFDPGSNHTYLITLSKLLGVIEKVEVQFSSGGVQAINPLRIFKKSQISIGWVQANYMSNIDPEVRNRLSSRLCPLDSADINSGGKPTTYVRCNQKPNSTRGQGFPFKK